MADFGVTATGFTLKRLSDILTDLTTALSLVTDPTTGETLTVDLEDADDPLVQVVNAFGDALSVAWEELELAYDAYNPSAAIGAGLSGLVQLNGITRQGGTKSEVVVTLTGDPDYVMPAGKRVSTLDDVSVFELPLVAFDESGDALVVAEAVEEGPVEAEAGTIVKIVTPMPGWDTVTNALDAVLGTLEETDTVLRARRQQSTATPSSSIIEAIASGVANLEGVTFAKAFQNATLAVDVRGIPAKSVAVVVVGGDDDEIAETIFNRTPLGSETFGSTEVEVTDGQLIPYDIQFSRPTEVDVYVQISIEVVQPSVWPSDGEDQIKSAILLYAAGGASTVGIVSGFDQDGYPPGETVYASSLYIPVLSVPGTKILVLGVSDGPPDSTPEDNDEVVIAWDEIAAFDANNITIAVG